MQLGSCTRLHVCLPLFSILLDILWHLIPPSQPIFPVLALHVLKCSSHPKLLFIEEGLKPKYEGISKSFEPNMEKARNLDLLCFIFQRSPLPTPHTCPI